MRLLPIELKGDMKPLTSKVYLLSKSEQVALDDFVAPVYATFIYEI